MTETQPTKQQPLPKFSVNLNFIFPCIIIIIIKSIANCHGLVPSTSIISAIAEY